MPGVVVSRVNMSPKFMKELLDAMRRRVVEVATVKGIQDLPRSTAARAVAIRSTTDGCVESRTWRTSRRVGVGEARSHEALGRAPRAEPGQRVSGARL